VFKLSLSYFEGKFRTPYVLPAFAHNALKAKEKGLLDFEKPVALEGKIPFCSRTRTNLETFFGRFGTVSSIKSRSF